MSTNPYLGRLRTLSGHLTASALPCAEREEKSEFTVHTYMHTYIHSYILCGGHVFCQTIKCLGRPFLFYLVFGFYYLLLIVFIQCTSWHRATEASSSR